MSLKASESDMDKMRSTIKQFVRDWSVEVSSARFGISTTTFDVHLYFVHFERVNLNETPLTSQSWTSWNNSLDMSLKKNGMFILFIIYTDLLAKHVPFPNRGDVKILVPGAGLARLAFDIALQGVFYFIVFHPV